MKKLFIGLLLTMFGVSAMAQHYGYRPNHRHHGYQPSHRSYNWVAPLVIGGALGYALTRPPVVVEQPVIVAPPPPPPPVMDEFVYINGRYYRRDVIMINGVWQEVLIPQ